MKTFVVDTNVILHDPACFEVFTDNELVIPLSVLDELDNNKARHDEVGRNARAAIRFLDNLRASGSLSVGVKKDQTIIKVEMNHQEFIPEGLDVDKVDNRIISVALGLQKEGKVVKVISKDINLRVKCDAVGLAAEDYTTDKIADKPTSIYSGVQKLEVSSEIINKLFENESIPKIVDGHPNQFFVLKSIESENHVGIARLIGDNLVAVKPVKNVMSITPRNAEQKMAFDLLMDPNIKLVTLIGKAGSGKTLLSTAAALYHVLHKSKEYSRMFISRPIQPMGKDIGYLPGDIEEKLDPWMQPIYDNLEFLLGSDRQMLNMYKDQGLIHVEALTYIRGRSIPNSLLLLDEAQNLSPHEIKTIITRVGEGTKIIITGDIEQIDNPYVDFADNGLTHVIERFKDYPIAGHITLRKGERSKLAALASEIL